MMNFLPFNHGNHIRKQQTKYSIEMMDKEMQSQINVCNKEFFKSMGEGGLI